MKCEHCGKEFETPYRRQKYCSAECAGDAGRYLKREHQRDIACKTPRKCRICGKMFSPDKIHPYQKYCSAECGKAAGVKLQIAKRAAYHKAKTERTAKPKQPGKTLAEWCKEADQCNLDYGTYRAFIAQGKSFDELKAQNRPPQNHSHVKTG